MQKRMEIMVIFLVPTLLFSVLLFVALSEEETRKYPSAEYYGPFKEDKMIGFVYEVKKDENMIIIDISEWEKRSETGPNSDGMGYSYHAKISDETVIKFENGEKANLDDIKKDQIVLILPARGDDDFEGHPKEIILLD